MEPVFFWNSKYTVWDTQIWSDTKSRATQRCQVFWCKTTLTGQLGRKRPVVVEGNARRLGGDRLWRLPDRGGQLTAWRTKINWHLGRLFTRLLEILHAAGRKTKTTHTKHLRMAILPTTEYESCRCKLYAVWYDALSQWCCKLDSVRLHTTDIFSWYHVPVFFRYSNKSSLSTSLKSMFRWKSLRFFDFSFFQGFWRSNGLQ